MKRRPQFLILLLTAAITFGTLMAALGPRHFNHLRHCAVNDTPAQTK